MWRDFSEDRLSMVGAGTAFYILLALVPALSAFVAVYGLIFDRVSVVEQVASLSSLLAPEVRSVIEGQLTRLASESSGSLGVAFAVSLTLSLWSASAGIKALMDGLNIVYAEEEKRGFVQYYATALVLTLAGLVGFVAIIAATVAVPLALDYVAPGQAGGFVRTASYVVLLGFLWVGLITLYRWGPSREHAKWRWLAPGTIAAMVALAIFAMLFSWFARTFAGYASYGSLGAIIAFMTWVWISTVIVLLGAEINAEVEYRTTHDTTIGPARPMGERGAVMADSAPGTHQVRHSRSEPTR
ncbi:MAG: YihY/virulence factor BrkB family protein [Hyphomicrobiaceae bacterium]